MYFRIGILRVMIRVFKNLFCIIIIYAIGNVGIITVLFFLIETAIWFCEKQRRNALNTKITKMTQAMRTGTES